jgi:hypothetical protein
VNEDNMKSERIERLLNLVDRWETLAGAAAVRIENSTLSAQASFYAGVLFGLGVSRDELSAALADEMANAAKPSAGLMKSSQQHSN